MYIMYMYIWDMYNIYIYIYKLWDLMIFDFDHTGWWTTWICIFFLFRKMIRGDMSWLLLDMLKPPTSSHESWVMVSCAFICQRSWRVFVDVCCSRRWFCCQIFGERENLQWIGYAQEPMNGPRVFVFALRPLSFQAIHAVEKTPAQKT